MQYLLAGASSYAFGAAFLLRPPFALSGSDLLTSFRGHHTLGLLGLRRLGFLRAFH